MGDSGPGEDVVEGEEDLVVDGEERLRDEEVVGGRTRGTTRVADLVGAEFMQCEYKECIPKEKKRTSMLMVPTGYSKHYSRALPHTFREFIRWVYT
jgi:hypothetical protein